MLLFYPIWQFFQQPCGTDRIVIVKDIDLSAFADSGRFNPNAIGEKLNEMGGLDGKSNTYGL